MNGSRMTKEIFNMVNNGKIKTNWQTGRSTEKNQALEDHTNPKGKRTGKNRTEERKKE